VLLKFRLAPAVCSEFTMTSEAEIQPRPSVDDTGEKRFISDRTMREGADGLENVPSLEGGRPLPQNSSASSESRDATDEEVETLAHVTDNVPFAAWAVIFAGAAERFTYFGLIAPWRELGVAFTSIGDEADQE